MSELMKIIMSLSVSGSFLAVLLLVFKPFYKNRLSCTWQYYIWLLVLLRMLLPVTPEANLMGMLADQSSDSIMVGESGNTGRVNTEQSLVSSENIELSPAGSFTESNEGHGSSLRLSGINNSLSSLFLYLWLLIPLISAGLIFRMVLSHYRYTKMIRKYYREITDEGILNTFAEVRKAMNIKRKIPLYMNNSVNTPLLIGVLKPLIVLPPVDFSVDNYRMIFRHELIHYKRNDILYKWFTELMVCLHWFNPLIYFARKEIYRNCELSCDKAVLALLEADEKHNYGEALMALVNNCRNEQKYMASVGMSEDGRNIKERLNSIMLNSKSSAFIRILSFLLALVFATGAYFLGSYAYPITSNYKPELWHPAYFFEQGFECDGDCGDGHCESVDEESWFYKECKGRFLSIVIDGKRYVQRLSYASETPMVIDKKFSAPFNHISYADKASYLFHDSTDQVSYDYIIKLYETVGYEYWQLKDSAIIIQGQRGTFKELVSAASRHLVEHQYLLRDFDSFEDWVGFLGFNMRDKGALAVYYVEDAGQDEDYLNYQEAVMRLGGN